MTKRKKKVDLTPARKALPYLAAGILTIAIAVVGSVNKEEAESNLALDNLAKNDYGVSIDKLSELYVVADVSNAFGLASAQGVASSYVVANTIYSSGQTTATGKFDKPNITDVPSSRGVIEYVVKDGDTMESIAATYGISTDEIRWSNGLKTTAVSPGTTLYLPSSSGIVYQVKAGDTLQSIASKYGSNVDELVALNDLELSGISDGMRIIVKGGSLPVTERPEYSPPVQQSYSTYSYLGNSSERQNMTLIGVRYDIGGPYAPGQCTQWAWYMRQDLPGSLGNANSWAYNASALGFLVDHVPSVGAIFQTGSGWYGHVGYVESVNGDGSIVVTEMNYGGMSYRVTRSTIPASAVGKFNYIH